MSPLIIIRADGMEWTLQTFIDAYGFIRTDGERPDFAYLEGTVDLLTAGGELRQGVEMSAVNWQETLAVNVPKGSMRLALCHGCGSHIVPLSISSDGNGVITLSSDLCSDCEGECW